MLEEYAAYGYAGFWKRAGACAVDLILLLLLHRLLLGVVLALLSSANASIREQYDALFDMMAIGLNWLYFSAMESSPLQGTVGKLAIGIEVTDIYGGRIGFIRASIRHFSQFVSCMTLGVGFLMAGFTRHNQALHDQIAGCLVSNREPPYRQLH